MLLNRPSVFFFFFSQKEDTVVIDKKEEASDLRAPEPLQGKQG